MNAIPKPPSIKKNKEGRPKRDDFELEELAEKIGEAKEGSSVSGLLCGVEKS